ncbi:hypothetical protein [Fundidesulfovibrio agrisoli]|uniref:hypothetical protein n=1 Tax=Fundidesulfovibrio agrisoli TaxID=2922717 RepID=UPI001FAB45DF|nr:hypothetical protein [Fundidesulfovibrio agrisoli]
MAKTYCVVIRAHYIDEHVSAVVAEFNKLLGEDQFVVLDTDSVCQCSGLSNVLLYGSADIRRAGLLFDNNIFEYSKWYNGDYSLYIACRMIDRQYDDYWFIEYDVLLNFDDIRDFFDHFQEIDCDFISARFRKADKDWIWANNLEWFSSDVYGSFFPVVRVSRRAINMLYYSRVLCGQQFVRLGLDRKCWPHAEAYCPTALQKFGFDCADINNFGKQFYTPDSLKGKRAGAHYTDDDRFGVADSLIYHPVYDATQKKFCPVCRQLRNI